MSELKELIYQIGSLTKEENEKFGNIARLSYLNKDLIDFLQGYLNRQLQVRRDILFQIEVSDYYQKLREESKDMPPEFMKVVDDNLWDLLADAADDGNDRCVYYDEEETKEDDTNTPCCR